MLGLLDRKKHLYKGEIVDLVERARVSEKASYGNVAYNIKESYRGHHYAYYACKILFKIAKEEFGLKELIITCNPDNDASYKTLKRLGGKLVEIAQIPYDHELYEKGDRFKCIFRFKL